MYEGDIETTASHPGRVELELIQWMKHKKKKTFINILFLIIELSLCTLSLWFLLALLLHLYFIKVELNYLKEHLITGCVNPAKCLNYCEGSRQYTIAVSTDLSKGHGSYPIIKIIKTKLPINANILNVGDRLTCVSFYQPSPYEYWNDFSPIPVLAATSKIEENDRLIQEIDEEDWEEFDDELTQVKDQTKLGLHPISWSNNLFKQEAVKLNINYWQWFKADFTGMTVLIILFTSFFFLMSFSVFWGIIPVLFYLVMAYAYYDDYQLLKEGFACPGICLSYDVSDDMFLIATVVNASHQDDFLPLLKVYKTSVPKFRGAAMEAGDRFPCIAQLNFEDDFNYSKDFDVKEIHSFSNSYEDFIRLTQLIDDELWAALDAELEIAKSHLIKEQVYPINWSFGASSEQSNAVEDYMSSKYGKL